MQSSPSVLGEVKKDIATRVMRAISKAQDRGDLPKELSVEVKMET